MRTVMFEALPADTPSYELVLRVSFPAFGQHSEGWVERGYVIDATVLDVVQGEYDQPTVPVVIGFGTCDVTPFGQTGLIIGHFEAAPDENGAERRVFIARAESFGDRFEPVRN